jgi:hypothetical protein
MISQLYIIPILYKIVQLWDVLLVELDQMIAHKLTAHT